MTTPTSTPPVEGRHQPVVRQNGIHQIREVIERSLSRLNAEEFTVVSRDIIDSAFPPASHSLLTLALALSGHRPETTQEEQLNTFARLHRCKWSYADFYPHVIFTKLPNPEHQRSAT